eukprot:5497573-Prymnesium_polylepis.1
MPWLRTREVVSVPQSDTCIHRVEADPPVVDGRVWVEVAQAAKLDTGERREPRLVRVEDDAHGDAERLVYGAVQRDCGALHRSLALEDVAHIVDEQQVLGGHFEPVNAVADDEEGRVIRPDAHREVASEPAARVEG